jgi:AraC family transcriptional regulator of adaptative response/methylated-DNA-[protein]-cysteine methyltransferase
MSDQLWFEVGNCSVGKFLLASSIRGIRCLWLGDDHQALTQDFLAANPGSIQTIDQMPFECKALGLLLAGTISTYDVDVPFDVRGTPFQLRTWDAIRKIPRGRTWSYIELADSIGAPTSARAVAGACAANNIAVFIPCHRVIGASGALSGYRWGIDKKRHLLDIEAGVQSPAA